MEKIKVVIVDDSPFSIAVIQDILEKGGLQVVGSAGSLEEVKEVIADTNPDLVTMDITMPGTDGFECTRAVHEINKDIKVIMISSMMDQEIEYQAKKNRISGFIQKPVDADELLTTVKRIMVSGELYELLQNEYFEVFKESLKVNMNRFIHESLTYEAEEDLTYTSEGIDIVIGIIGKFSGRMLLGFSKETAENITTKALKREPKSSEEMTVILSEMSNIIAGNACSALNKKEQSYSLRVSPPSILSGDNTYISPADYQTHTAIAKISQGKISLNIGFSRGDETWM